MKNSYSIITWEARGVSLPAVFTEKELWLTQKTISKLLGVTAQNITIHLREWRYNNISPFARKFLVPQTEGGRIVTRELRHYPLSTVFSLANATRRVDYILPVIELAKLYEITVPKVFTAIRKEWQFNELLMGSLSGIVKIEPQYRLNGYILDFYIPELKLGIEYDEYHHQKPNSKKEDISRQDEIQQSTGIKFIRIQQGNEIGGLNEIIKLLIVNSMSRLFAMK